MQPETTYARSSEGHVAFQVVGDGPRDLVFVPDWCTNVDLMWEEPSLARFLNRLGSFSRLICFDKRGTGASDPVPLRTLPTLEQWMDDVGTVMNAAGSQRAAVFGHAEGGPMAILFAATFPERTSALILGDTFARLLRADDYGCGLPRASVPKFLAVFEKLWGTGGNVETIAPSMAGSPSFRLWRARYERCAMGPGAATATYRTLFDIDLRPVLSAIRVPTLVMHRADDGFTRVEHGRYLAEHIPGAKYVELPGRDHLYHAAGGEALLDEVQEFLTGARETPDENRVLATILFTDIVGSTERAAALGDRAWRDLLDHHNVLVRREIERWRGREVKVAGDGFLATFDGPARAVRCAMNIRDVVGQLGIQIRAGVHTGECEVMGADVTGLAVHIGARVAAAAGPREVLVSSTVKDLVAGSGIQFLERGTHVLKGVPDEWQLFAAGSGMAT